MSDVWYTRIRGQVNGPVDRSQIAGLIRRQRLGRHDEISADKINWRRVSDYPDLFAPAIERKIRKAPDESAPDVDDSFESGDVGDLEPEPESDRIELHFDPPPAQQSDEEWYFATGGQEFGPVSRDELRSMLAEHRVLPSDAVWTEALVHWTPAERVPVLAPGGASGTVGPEVSPVVSELAVNSLVLGVLGLTLLFGIGSVPAIIIGHLALGQIHREAGRLTGRGQALAGVITGYIGMALSLILLVYVIISSGFLRG